MARWRIRLVGHPSLTVETEADLDEKFDRFSRLRRRPKLFRPCPGVALVGQVVLGVERLPEKRGGRKVIRGFTGGENA